MDALIGPSHIGKLKNGVDPKHSTDNCFCFLDLGVELETRRFLNDHLAFVNRGSRYVAFDRLGEELRASRGTRHGKYLGHGSQPRPRVLSKQVSGTPRHRLATLGDHGRALPRILGKELAG